ncbi:MAG TPA: zf-TFIIB domain-containing protein [Thermomicrobiales bacterium]|nr:zf-TFIIB domain-containing protein [Thermomicrobiales bacterium]
MRCPTDSTELIITDRQGITVHYCPTCKGGWLEHAELDATIVRAASNGMALGEPVGVFDQIDGVIEDRPRRRRDKYSDDEYDDLVQERQRKGKKRRAKRDMFDDMFGF